MAITNVIPQLRTIDLEAAIEFYVNRLGFTLDFRFSDFYAGVRSGNHMIHLKLVDDPDPAIDFVRQGDHLFLYLEVTDAEAEARRLKANDVTFHRELERARGTSLEFQVLDPDGHILCFGQHL